MATIVRPLGPIIRPASWFKGEPGRYCVAVRNIKSWVLESAPGMFSPKPEHIYRICTTDDPLAKASGTTDRFLIDTEGASDVPVMVRFSAVCPAGNQNMVALKLGQSGDPDHEFSRILQMTSQVEAKNLDEGLSNDYEVTKLAFERSVASKVGAHTSLAVSCELVFVNPIGSKKIEINDSFRVRCSDSDREYTLKARFELDPIIGGRFRAVKQLESESEMQALIVSSIQRVFAQHVVLGQLHDELAGISGKYYKRRSGPTDIVTERQGSAFESYFETTGSSFKDFIANEIKSECEARGFGIGFYELSVLAPDFPEAIVKVDDLTASVKPASGTKPVELQSRVILQLADLSKYYRKQVDIVEFLRVSFQTVAAEICFDKEYITYIRPEQWEKTRASIEALLSERVRERGYLIRQITSDPRLEESKFLSMEQRIYPLENMPLKGAQDQKVPLTVRATFSLKDWEHDGLVSKLNEQVNLAEDIKVAVSRTVAPLVSQIRPEDYFLFFNVPDSPGDLTELDPEQRPRDSRGIAISRKKQIELAVTTMLQNDYAADVASVDVVTEKTPVSDRVLSLVDQKRTFELEVEPFGTAGGKPWAGAISTAYMFTIEWLVTRPSAEGWSKISREGISLEEIEGTVRESLVGTLSAMASEDLTMLGRLPQGDDVSLHDVRQTLVSALSNSVSVQTAAAYGAIVQIITARRHRTDEEGDLIGALKTAGQSKVTALQMSLAADEAANRSRIEHKRDMDELARSSEKADRRMLDDLKERKAREGIMGDDQETLLRDLSQRFGSSEVEIEDLDTDGLIKAVQEAGVGSRKTGGAEHVVSRIAGARAKEALGQQIDEVKQTEVEDLSDDIVLDPADDDQDMR